MSGGKDDEDDFLITQDADVRNFNFHLFKADNDLFNEESNVASKAIVRAFN